jgi:serine/threonine protein kinase
MNASSPPPCLSNYTLKSQIGTGGFANVWLAQHRLAQIDVAIKAVDHSGLSPEERTRLIREITLIKQMDHPFISKLFEVINGDQHTYFVMEYATKGSVLDFINNYGRLLEVPARRLFGQLICALEYLHDVRRIAHRDLKAENVLLDRHCNIRLIDFGLSNSIGGQAFSSQCGSPAYCPPEMVLGQPYSKSADIWSAGVLLYAMVVGELPFDDVQVVRTLHKIVNTTPTYPRFLSQPLIDLLQKILTKNPENRITLQGIKSHPWFSCNEYSKLASMAFSGEQWLVHGIVRELVDKIAAMGADAKELTQALLSHEYSPLSAIYLMLRRDQMTEEIRKELAGEDLKDADQLLMETGLPRPSSSNFAPKKLSCTKPANAPPSPPKVQLTARGVRRPMAMKTLPLPNTNRPGEEAAEPARPSIGRPRVVGAHRG